jgi:hypothetical protein
MQIVNDTEIYEPSECYFTVAHDPRMDPDVMISITPISFWEDSHYLSDQFGDHSLTKEVCNKLEAAGIWGACDSTWTSDSATYSVDTVRAALLDLGFVESQEMHDFLNR